LKIITAAPAPALAAAESSGAAWPAESARHTLPPAEAAPTTKDSPPLAPPVVPERVSPLRLEDLGTADEIYPGSTFRQLLSCVLFVVCLGIAGCAAYAVVNQPNKNPLPALTVIGMFTFAGLACLWYALKLRELSYLVFPDALVEKHGSETQIIPWDKIREVHQTMHPAWKNYRLVTRKGFDIEFTGNVKNYRALGDRIEEKVVQKLLPAALVEVEQGKSLRFGPLTVSRAALQFDGHTAGWNQVSMVVGLNHERDQLNRRSQLMHLFVHSPVRSKAFKVEVGKIPNYCLLIELVRRNWPQCLPPEA
jgi:membrane protein YdbS with pleckstrin-like domain